MKSFVFVFVLLIGIAKGNFWDFDAEFDSISDYINGEIIGFSEKYVSNDRGYDFDDDEDSSTVQSKSTSIVSYHEDSEATSTDEDFDSSERFITLPNGETIVQGEEKHVKRHKVIPNHRRGRKTVKTRTVEMSSRRNRVNGPRHTYRRQNRYNGYKIDAFPTFGRYKPYGSQRSLNERVLYGPRIARDIKDDEYIATKEKIVKTAW